MGSSTAIETHVKEPLVSLLSEANPQIDSAMMEQAVVKAIRSGIVLSSHVEFPKISLAAGAQFDRLWVAEADVQAVLTDVYEAIVPFLKQ
jgi:multiple sugar transport system substrate-binding protein